MTEGTYVAVANAQEGAAGFGHNALMVGNDKTGWTFISKEGREGGNSEGSDNNVLSGGPAKEPIIEKFGTLNELLGSTGKEIKGYNRAAVFSIDPSQAGPLIETMTGEANSKYSVLTNNCVMPVRPQSQQWDLTRATLKQNLQIH